METKLTKKFAKYFDHTQLKPNATKDEIDRLISEAKEYDFASICVNPYWVKYASQKLATTDVKVVTTIGFPLGATTTAAKVYEAEDSLLTELTSVTWLRTSENCWPETIQLS